MLRLLLKPRLCLVVFLLGVLFKFWLIWETEIADAVDDPHEYVLQILFPSNGGLAYPPGTGLVGQLFRALGVPFRLGLEVAFLAATVLVIRSLFAWPWQNALSLGLFLFVAFDPAVAELFSHLFSDQVWLVETLLGTALFVLAWRDEARPSWRLMALAGFFLGLSTITRSTVVPLLFALIALAAISCLLLRAQRRPPGSARNLAAFFLGLWTLLLGLLIIYEGACAYNARCHGYSGVSIIDCRDYKNFYLCLQSVGEPTGDRYFPVDHARRQLIAQAGPNSQWLMTEIDHNETYKKVGFKNYGVLDIPAGWFHFAVFNAAFRATHGDLLQCYALFGVIEEEIAQAKRDGRLHVRPVIPLPDSRIALVGVALPDSLRATIDQVLHLPPPDAFSAVAGGAQYQSPEFTEALTRRAVQASPEREKIWRGLGAAYSLIYLPALPGIACALLFGFMALLVMKWNRLEKIPLAFLARQLFLLLFIIYLLWYVLFDASGMPVLARYMIFNHIMLPVLVCYYAAAGVRLLRGDYRL